MNLARVAAARSCLGMRFHHQARGPEFVDCAGLLVVAEAKLGRALVETYEGYGRTPHGGRLRAALAANFTPITRAPEPGDVVLLSWGAEPQHVAIFGDYVHGGLSLIHTYAKVKKVVEHIYDADWQARFVEAFE